MADARKLPAAAPIVQREAGIYWGRISMRVLFLLIALLVPCAAQSLDQPTSLLAGDPIDLFFFSLGGTLQAENGNAERVDVEGMDFARAWRLKTASLPPTYNEWDMRIRARGGAAVQKDDLILATFWIRCMSPEGGECATRLNVERSGAPYTKSFFASFLSYPDWRQVKVAFRMAEDYSPGGYFIDFWMSQQVQTVEVGGVSLLDYGQGVEPADIGIDALYEGAAEDAPWRAAALERIDAIRKADLSVLVVDAEGNPVPGAEVRALMTTHSFGWGTAVAAARLLDESDDSEKYRQFIRDNFNMVVLENDLKWPQWEHDRNPALNAIEWLRNNGIDRIRGHNLIWPKKDSLPEDVVSLVDSGDAAALRSRIQEHFTDELSATAGMLVEWDVVNEPAVNRYVQELLGDDEVAAWYRMARELDPTDDLYVNDYSIIEAGGGDLAHRNKYYQVIQNLMASEAPVDGIGIQGHFDRPTPPETMLRILDRFSEFGLPIEITEFDFKTTDEQLQAQFTRDLLIAMFSHPSIKAFLMWGFWEGSHWIPSGAMIRQDWTGKPSYDVWRDLVYRQWWTDEAGVSGDGGAWAVRGFQGEYEVTVTMGDRTVTLPVSLGKDGAQVTAVLP
jgi:endo-1,4-beta-xylanase